MSVPVPNVLNWPLGGIDENGRLSYTRDDDSVREVIRNVIAEFDLTLALCGLTRASELNAQCLAST